MVVVEDVSKGHWMSWQAQLWCIGVLFYIMVQTANQDIGLKLVSVTTLKRFATGNGKAKKIDMINAVFTQKRIRLDKKDDHVADAIWLGEFALYEATL